MLTVARRAYVAVPLLLLGLGGIPPQAIAQVPCVPNLTCPPDTTDSTPPTVRITSPASGATVSGTITVAAEASDNVGVAGVQFQYNGIDFDAEDTSSPYTATAYTNNVPDGTYTLTAVARDAAGNRTTSDPVSITVANHAPSPTGVRRYEETDPAVSFSAGWTQEAGWTAWSGGTAMESTIPGAQATFTFHGTSATWIGVRSPNGGIVRVSVDGVLASEVDLFSRSTEFHVPVFTAQGLADGSHTLTIEVTGLKNTDSQAVQAPGAWVWVDAFDVPAQVVSHLQDTDPDISYTAGWTVGDASTSTFSGRYAHISTTPGAQATLAFNGTSISWIGYRGPDAGIARVFLDGALAGQVDLYSPEPSIQAVVFASPLLADANHTLTIEATGLGNAASSDARVVVDAFDVTAPGTRFEETDGSVTYTGEWSHNNHNLPWSMGTAAVSNTQGARATFSFTGTAVRWIGCRKPTMGIANVYLDGVFMAEIDSYRPLPAQGYQDTIFEATGLASGRHTLTIEATGRLNPDATNSPELTVGVVVDAFDVRP